MKSLPLIIAAFIGLSCISFAEQQTPERFKTTHCPVSFGRMEFRELADSFSIDVTVVKRGEDVLKQTDKNAWDPTGLMAWLLKVDGTLVPCVQFPQKRGGIGNFGVVNYSNEFQFRPKVPVSELAGIVAFAEGALQCVKFSERDAK